LTLAIGSGKIVVEVTAMSKNNKYPLKQTKHGALRAIK